MGKEEKVKQNGVRSNHQTLEGKGERLGRTFVGFLSVNGIFYHRWRGSVLWSNG